MTFRVHKALRGRLRGKGGFSLTEMLATLLILTLASTLLATGVPVAIDTYHKTVNSANAQVALSTTATALRRELSLSTDVRAGNGDGKVYYFSDSEKCWISIGNSTDYQARHGLEKQYYLGVPTGSGVEGLVPDGEPFMLIANSVIAATRPNDSLYVMMDPVLDSAVSDVDVAIPNLRVQDGTGSDANTLALVSEYRVLTRF